jgi:hypothetical protein
VGRLLPASDWSAFAAMCHLRQAAGKFCYWQHWMLNEDGTATQSSQNSFLIDLIKEMVRVKGLYEFKTAHKTEDMACGLFWSNGCVCPPPRFLLLDSESK